jgi:hypothetical protein
MRRGLAAGGLSGARHSCRWLAPQGMKIEDENASEDEDDSRFTNHGIHGTHGRGSVVFLSFSVYSVCSVVHSFVRVSRLPFLRCVLCVSVEDA